MTSRGATRAAGAVICLLLWLCILQPPVNAQNDLESVYVSLDRLIGFLRSNGGNKTAEEMAIKLIEIYGLGFRLTEGDYAKLRAINASEKLIRSVENAKLPPPQPTKPYFGALFLRCWPVDCDVHVDATGAGRTREGTLLLPKSVEGQVSVSVSCPECEDVPKQTATIVRGSIAQLHFVLRLSSAALHRLGALRYERMMEAAGPANLAERPRTAQIGGSLVAHSGKGQSTAWRVSGLLDSAHASLKFVRLRENYRLECVDNECRSGKKLKPAIVQELTSVVKLLMAAQLDRILQVLSGPDFTRKAIVDASGKEIADSFKVQGPSSSYVVALDRLARPVEVRCEEGVFAGGTRLLYADYRAGILLPKTILVVLPGGERGIELRLDTAGYHFPSARDRGRNSW